MLQNEIESDLDFGEKLEGDDIDSAREKYQEWLETADETPDENDG